MDSSSILQKLNSPEMYLVCGGIILFVAAVCVIFMIRAYRAGKKLGMDTKKMKRVILFSATFSVLPAVGILLGVIALAGSLGIPWPWLRLSVIGALHYETQVAQGAAEQVGMSKLSASEMTAQAFVTIAFLMSVCIIWGMVLSAVLNKMYLKKLGGNKAGEAAEAAAAETPAPERAGAPPVLLTESGPDFENAPESLSIADMFRPRPGEEIPAPGEGIPNRTEILVQTLAKEGTGRMPAPGEDISRTEEPGLSAGPAPASPAAPVKEGKKRSFGDIAMSAMFIGLVSAYIGSYIGGWISGKGLFTFLGDYRPLIVALVSAAFMGLFLWLSEKKKLAWLDGFSVAVSMLAGMAVAVFL